LNEQDLPDKEIQIKMVKSGFHLKTMTRTKDYPYATHQIGSEATATLEDAIKLVRDFFGQE